MTEGSQYRDALRERMTAFTEEELAKLQEAQDEDGDSPSSLSKVLPQALTRYQVTSLAVSDEGVLATTLAGTEIFQIPKSRMPESLTAATLIELAADTLGVAQTSLTLWEGAQELVGAAGIGWSCILTLREALDEDLRPIVCRRNQADPEPMLGEGMVQVNLADFPQDGCIQTIAEQRRYVTGEEHCWLIYTKQQVVSYHLRSGDVLQAIGYFPPAPVWKLPSGTRRWGGRRSDVWSTHCDLPQIQKFLDQHAALTNDRPIPRYQMIVDPNQFVTETPTGPVWVPCDFDISADGSPKLLGGPLSHAEPHLAQDVALPVLKAALPLLAKLRRPQLLLQERRLQVVFKAQRIIVPGRRSDGSDSEYVGLWHVDGHREHVAAVVLYYYNVDEELKGGDMEFCGREPMDILGIGDCSNNFEEFGRHSLRAALREEERRVTNCRVPICKGTLLVFSNYQMAHRVLRMVNTSAREASRDFVALFVLDPAFPPLRPAASVLANSFLMRRALQSRGLSFSNVTNIQEFSGDRQSPVALKLRRNAMLKEQLRPTGEFCGGAQVVTAGNGCYTMIGWLHHLLERDEETLEQMEENLPTWKGTKYLKALNLPPKNEGRGLSEVLSLNNSEVEQRLREWDEQAEVFQDEE